jgi:type III pantothenate kinase
MNSGVYFGYISMIEGMVKRIEEELGCKTTHIITGGLAEIFKEKLSDMHHESDLTLEGLREVYQKNKK